MRRPPPSSRTGSASRRRLFDHADRTTWAWAGRTEEGFGWWGRTKQPDIARMCGRVERWYARFPARDAKHLARRFRQNLEAQHRPALFELFVHEHLRRAGYRMRCELPRGGCQIDFLAYRHGRPAFYVEAKSPGETSKERRTRRFLGEVMDRLNKYKAPGFLVSVELSGNPTRPVPMKEFRLEPRLRAWLRSLDPARSLRKRHANPGHEERFRWPAFEEMGDARFEVNLEVVAIPQAVTPPVQFDSFAQMESTGMASLFRPDVPIAEAIAEKATRYGPLELPYLIAVNVSDFAAHRGEILEGIEAGLERAGPRAREIVSGVLLAFVPNISAAVVHAPVLYVNPRASQPIGEHAMFFRPLQNHAREMTRRS